MVFDPATGKTQVFPIPVPHQGIISVTPDESRKLAYISTCDDSRLIESTHFLILDMETGKYRDLLDCRHMYAFIVLDHLGRAYHPILGGEIARYYLRTINSSALKSKPSTANRRRRSRCWRSRKAHPINWEVSPDHKTLWCVAMSGNALYSYDLTQEGPVLAGRSHGPLTAGCGDRLPGFVRRSSRSGSGRHSRDF